MVPYTKCWLSGDITNRIRQDNFSQYILINLNVADFDDKPHDCSVKQVK